MSFTDYLARNPNPSQADVVDVLSGHLCRCTGYAGIVAAVLEAAGCPDKEKACSLSSKRAP
jgi:2-furoyl-CoA dehydrogenase 2Fe-2S iron sulfur subunit